MRTLLLVAHGSRVTSSNDTVVELAQRLQPKLESYGFDLITHAFLELTQPDIPEGIETLVAAGATQIVVLPYFLAPGTHVIDDIPELVKSAESNYPSVTFTVMQHLGGMEGILDLILDSASKVVIVT